MSDTEKNDPGLLTSLRAGLNAGALVGLLAGLFDGIVRALGIDSGLFLERWRIEGAWSALTVGLPRFGEVPGLVGCVAATVCLYVGVGMAVAGLVGLLLHRPLRRRTLTGRYEALCGLGFGFWIFLELYWWTRPVVFPGRSSVDPLRLAAAAATLLVGLGIGWFLPRLRPRVPRKVRLATPFVVVGLVLVGGVFLFADTRGSSDRGRPNERNRDLPNVLVFVVDALRQDVIGAYGNERVETPVIDRLAEEGVLFEEAFVQAPFTWTSFGSLLTGKYPRRHGLVKMAPGYALAANVTLPFYLQGAKRKDGVQLEEGDYVGAAFMTGTLSHGSGLLRGFDLYFEATVGHDLVDVHSRWSRFRSGLLPWLVKNKVTQRFDNQIVATTAIDWFRENAHRRFVSMVHFYSTHTPYDPPDEFKGRYVDPEYDGPVSSFYAHDRELIEAGHYEPTPADVEQIRNLYYGGVSQADHMIGEVLGELRRRGVLDDTIVIVTSDHGESLGEHSLWEHNFMYQDNLRIPLVMRFPRGLPQGTRVHAIVDSIDVLPTVADLAGLEPLDDTDDLDEYLASLGADERPDDDRLRDVVDGRSLLPLIRGEAERVREFSFAENGRYQSIQDDRWKLIVRRSALAADGWQKILAGEIEEPRFFSVGDDPLELENLFARETELAGHYFERLQAWSATMPIGEHMIRQSHRDLAAERRQSELGYAGGVGEEDDDEPPPHDDGDRDAGTDSGSGEGE